MPLRWYSSNKLIIQWNNYFITYNKRQLDEFGIN